MANQKQKSVIIIEDNFLYLIEEIELLEFIAFKEINIFFNEPYPDHHYR
jgi:hypothetical protein